MPVIPELSQMLARSGLFGGNLGLPLMHLRGFPSPVSVGKKGQGDGLPGAGDVDFKQPLESKLGTPRREMKALAPLAGGAGRLFLGLVFGWGWVWLRGLELYRAADIRRPGPSMNSFSKRIGWPRNDQKTER